MMDGDGSAQAATAALLTDVHGAPVTIDGWQRLEPWTVARVQLSGGGAAPTAIVKWVRVHPDTARSKPWRLRTEVAALRFVSDDLDQVLAPRVVAADLDAGLIVLEDLAPRVALDQLIRRDGAAAHAEPLAAYARARGALGAATAGHADRYHARRAALGPVDPAADRMRRLDQHRDEVLAHAAALGLPITGPAASDLAAALAELREPGPFLALSNGDAEANNALVDEADPADTRLIDFEFASYVHTLVDAVCLYVPGPAWLTVGDPVRSGLADHYRRTLAAGVPEAADDQRYGLGLAAACLSWALVRLQRVFRLDGRPPGNDSRLQLVATLEAAAHTAAAHRALPHLAGWMRRMVDLLRRRWPDADLDYTDPVAFRPYTPRH